MPADRTVMTRVVQRLNERAGYRVRRPVELGLSEPQLIAHATREVLSGPPGEGGRVGLVGVNPVARARGRREPVHRGRGVIAISVHANPAAGQASVTGFVEYAPGDFRKVVDHDIDCRRALISRMGAAA